MVFLRIFLAGKVPQGSAKVPQKLRRFRKVGGGGQPAGRPADQGDPGGQRLLNRKPDVTTTTTTTTTTAAGL